MPSLIVASLALAAVIAAPASAAPPPATGWHFTIEPKPTLPAGPALPPSTFTTCGGLDADWNGDGGIAWRLPAVGASVSWGELTLNYWKLTRDAERSITLEHYAALPPDGVPKVTHRGTATIVPGTPGDACKGNGRFHPRHKKLWRAASVKNRATVKRYLAAYKSECSDQPAGDTSLEELCDSLFASGKQAQREADIQERLANDPPDPAFRTIAKPAKARIAGVRAAGRLSRGAARKLKRMLSTHAQTTSLRRALLTAVERAEGAVVHGGPGDVAFERRQMGAASKYAKQLAAALDRLRSRSVATVRALKRDKVSSKVDRDAARLAQQRIAEQGLPAQTARWGLTPEQLDTLRSEIVEADPAELTSSFPGAFATRDRLASLSSEAKAMRAFSARVQKNPTAPAS